MLSPQRCGLDGVDRVREVDAKKVAYNKVLSFLRSSRRHLFSCLEYVTNHP